MAITNFIPEVWSARLQENLHKSLVFGALCSRNYEGDISQWGDTVHIPNLADITVRTYDPSQELADPDELSGTDVVLTIDHGAYYNFFLNDVDAAQSRADVMDSAMRNAAFRLAEDAESYILSAIRKDAGIKKTGAVPTKEEGGIYALLIAIKNELDLKHVPRYGRKLIIPVSVEGQLLLDDHFIGASAAGEARLAEGAIGRAAGFDIFVSTDLTDEVIAMIPDAVTFANQICRVDAYRPEKGFCDGVKGLNLCGCKVVLPNAVCHYKLTA